MSMYYCNVCHDLKDDDYDPCQAEPTIFGPDDSNYCCPDCHANLTEYFTKETTRYRNE